MIVSKTPLRVSFFGGGTDFPEYFRNNNSRVIGTAINKYIYLFQNKFYSSLFDHQLRLFYKEVEFVKDVRKIKHSVFKNILKKENVFKDIEIHASSELPGFVGLGTSSAFTVGLLNLINFYKYKKKLTKKILSEKSIYFERNILKENVGYQDQILAAHGGLNSIEFYDDTFKIKKLEPKFSLNKFRRNLILIYTGIQRTASHVEQKKIKKIKKNLSYLNNITDISNEAFNYFQKSKHTDFFGKLLHETWLQKKKLHKSVSNIVINNIYDKAIASGASGGKLLGAGAGGFILFYVKESNKKKFFKAFDKNRYITFDFEKNGSQIIKI